MVQQPDTTDTGEVKLLQNMRPITAGETIAFVTVGSLILVILACIGSDMISMSKMD